LLIYYFDDELIKEAKQFSKDNHKNFSSHNRDSELVQKHVFIGTIGELCFKKIYNILSLNLLDTKKGKKGDGGIDFINDLNVKIDVKTHTTFKNKKVYLNENLINSDLYVLLVVDLDKKFCVVKGICKKENILKNIQFDKFGSYVDVKFFKNE
jgi:hypothetical protein